MRCASAARPREVLGFVVLLFGAPFSGVSLSAQASTTGELRGIVTDALSRRPIPDASIVVSDNVPMQMSDSLGQFRFASLVSGTYVVRVRRVGYRESVERLTIEPGQELEQTFSLTRLPTVLKEVLVAGRIVRVTPAVEEAYKRAAKGRGFFFTRNDIQQLNPRDFQTLLNRIPTISANDRGITFQRCQGGLGSSRHEQEQSKVQLWVDGLRVSGRSALESVHDVLKTIHPSDIEIMEVYSGVARIPAEFLDDACAVIVIWTRRY